MKKKYILVTQQQSFAKERFENYNQIILICTGGTSSSDGDNSI